MESQENKNPGTMAPRQEPGKGLGPKTAAADRQKLRWVVLRHERSGEPVHFDLILETHCQADRLPTFRVREPPETWPGCTLEVLRQFDHRRIYLDFAGALSEGRGTVKRVGEGELLSSEQDGAGIRTLIVGGAGPLPGRRRMVLARREGEGEVYELRVSEALGDDATA